MLARSGWRQWIVKNLEEETNHNPPLIDHCHETSPETWIYTPSLLGALDLPMA